jgi:hypothetical protein
MPIGASLTDNARIDMKLANAQEGVYFFFQQTLRKLNNSYIAQQMHLLKYNSWQVLNSGSETCRSLIFVTNCVLISAFVG